jgi:hypothetical protein
MSWNALRLGLVASFMLWATSALGAGNKVTGVTIKAPDPNDVCVGDSVNYTVTWSGGDPFSSARWWYTRMNCNPPVQKDWFNGAYSSITNTEAQVADYDITVEVTFLDYPNGGTPYKSSTTVQLIVNPPDNVQLDTSCLNVPTATIAAGQQPNLNVLFKIRRGKRQVYLTAPVKEKLDRAPYGLNPPLIDWGAADFLSCTEPGVINDKKSLTVANAVLYNADPRGTVEDELDQYLRITLPTGCGDQDFDLADGDQLRPDLANRFHFRFIKWDNSSWYLSKP